MRRVLPTTKGSPLLKDSIARSDASYVARMRDAGAIIIGKTNVPEFGLGSNTYNPVFGPTANALQPRPYRRWLQRRRGGGAGDAASAGGQMAAISAGRYAIPAPFNNV